MQVNGRRRGEKCGLPPMSLRASATRLECRLSAGSRPVGMEISVVPKAMDIFTFFYFTFKCRGAGSV